MGRTRQALGSKFLEFEEVVEINRRMVLTYGGFFVEGDDNLANPGSLTYVLQAIQGSYFGHNPYPTLIEKAAALAWRIISCGKILTRLRTLCPLLRANPKASKAQQLSLFSRGDVESTRVKSPPAPPAPA